MPYIKKEGKNGREGMDPLIQPLIDHLKTMPQEEVDGVINYTVTKILKAVYPARYYHYNKAMGVLECIKQEFYRRIVASYEDKKILENGDVE